MDIKQGLENLQWHSKAARHLLTDIIDKLDELDGMDLITSSTKEETDELINRKDNATVDLYNRLQGFLNLLDWYNEELKNLYGLEKELKLKLIQNDTDSDEVIRRSGKVYGSIFSETYYPETWDNDDFTAKTHSLTTDLENRISNRLMRENEIPEFKERMVDYGANKDLISNEPMTRQRADRIASNLVFWIDHYLSNVCRCQKSIADILDEGYSLMYPDTSTELPSIFNQFALLRDNFRVRNAFVYAIKAGLMEVEGVYFKWLKKRQVLAYFCWSVGNALIHDTDKVQWSAFNGMFIAKRGKEYEVETNETLRRCYVDYEEKTPNHKRAAPPDGWETVDDIIEKVKN